MVTFGVKIYSFHRDGELDLDALGLAAASAMHGNLPECDRLDLVSRSDKVEDMPHVLRCRRVDGQQAAFRQQGQGLPCAASFIRPKSWITKKRTFLRYELDMAFAPFLV